MAMRLNQSPAQVHFMQNPYPFGASEDVSVFSRMSMRHMTYSAFFNFLVLRNEADAEFDGGAARAVMYVQNISPVAKEVRIYAASGTGNNPRAQWNEAELSGAIPDDDFFSILITSVGGSAQYTDIRCYINGVDMGTAGAGSLNGTSAPADAKNNGRGRVSMGMSAASTIYANGCTVGERALWSDVITPAEAIAITGNRLNPKDRSHKLVSFVNFQGGHPAVDEIAGVTEAQVSGKTASSRGEPETKDYFTFEGEQVTPLMPWQMVGATGLIPQIMHNRQLQARA